MQRGGTSRLSLADHLLQALVVLGAVALVAGLAYGIYSGLAAHNIGVSFDFLWQKSGLHLTEGLTLDWTDGVALVPYESGDSNLQALLLGLYNTLKVALVGIILSTMLGLVVGAGRVSRNWAVSRFSLAFVELIRNTPLLIQLFFWYFAVVLRLPPMREAAHLYGVIASQQGIYFPSPQSAWPGGEWLVLASLILAGAIVLVTRGRPARRGILLGALIAAWIATMAWKGSPLQLDMPVASRFRASGGLAFTPEFAAILLALVVYTAAFIAEVVRGSIEAVSGRQWMAAHALGLKRGQAMRYVILPQAFRMLIPPLVNQYLNLAKNTSLAIAIGFPDLFNIYGTVANQTGRSMEGILFVMVAYLLINWLISLFMNMYNRRLLARGQR
ncbi:ABC transporter permease subunit [Allopusillimonas soli]|uniref:ABC transporter permease subunit n=1 Tax=Allopusillimonas soli TaxID=659016 RepID=A0A853FGP9_9BURK|nr:ABC transporter permease subunit [Allopusillimonas soli]NYT37970.1 ABC transporter permease subunit [Allopusillimonas soli]TEA73866.1 ABC transporter permease subunit [Allopusillimonas soli]